MIELPPHPAPRSFAVTPIDFGYIQRPSTGAATTRVDRPGGRFSASVTFPPMKLAVANAFHARLLRARREGLRIEVPLREAPQGIPGGTVVDGPVTGGIMLAVRGLTPGYVAREGYWLNVIDGAGSRYLHKVAQTVAVGADGKATIILTEALRTALADGATVELAHPVIEGWVTGEMGWMLSVEWLVNFGAEIVIEETA